MIHFGIAAPAQLITGWLGGFLIRLGGLIDAAIGLAVSGDANDVLDLDRQRRATPGDSGSWRETGAVPAGTVGSFAAVRRAVDSGA